MKLFPKLLLLALLPVLVTCALLFAIWQSLTSESLRDQAEKMARAELDAELNGALGIFQQVDRSLAAVGKTPGLRGTSDVARAQALADLRSFMPGRIEDLQFHALDGSVYASNGRKVAGEKNLVDDVRRNSGRTHVSPAEINPVTGSTVVRTVVPLRSETKEITGALCALVKVTDIYEQILTAQKGKAGRAILVDPRGAVGSLLFQPDQRSITASLVSAAGAPTGGPEAEISKAMLSAKQGRHEFVLGGRRHVLFFRNFPETGWRLGMAYREDDIFAARNRMRLFGLIILGGCFVLSLAASHSVWRFIVKPLKEVERAHREFAAGDLSTRAAVTTDDEVAALGESFNGMAEKLEASTKAATNELERRRRAETALVEHETLFRDMIDKTPAILFIKDLEGRYMMVNARFEALVGSPLSEICGLTDYDLFPKNLADSFRANDRRVVETERVQEFEEVVVDGGRDVGVLSIRFPLRNHDGKIYAVGGVSTEVDERMKAHRALRDSESRLRALVDHAPDAITVLDLDRGKLVEANPAAERLFGLSRSELIMRPMESLSPDFQPDGRASAAFGAEMALKAEKDGFAAFEWTYRSASGLNRVCSVRLSPHPGEGRRLRASIVDVSEQRRTARMLETLVRGTSQVGQAFFASLVKELATFFGARHAFVGTPVPGNRRRIRTLCCWANGNVVPNFEYDLEGTPCAVVLGSAPCWFNGDVCERFPDDRLLVDMGARSYVGVPLVNPVGTVVGILSILSDGPLEMDDGVRSILSVFASRATSELERLQADEEMARKERQRRESDERYRLLVEGARDAIVTVTPDGAIASTNAATQTLTGWPRDFWIGKPFEPLVHPDDMPVAQALLASCLNGVKPPPTELRVRRIDGTYVPMELVPTPLFRDSKLINILVVARDISDRMKAREAQARLETQLRQAQKMEAIGTLAGGIAHDFNNILGAIMGNIDLARMDIAPDHPAAESLEEVAKASKRASNLVRQILTFSRKQEQSFLPVSLSEVVREASSLLRATIPASIEIRTRLSEADPHVLADSTQLHQVLMNLGTNAAHAMRAKGGVMEISEALEDVDPESAAAVNGLRPGRYVRLTVADNGVGMDRATLDRIFEPFFTTKAQGEGTGLGLSVVHGIVRNHGGVITVESDPGQGTRFHVLLPVTLRQAGAPDDGRNLPPDGNGREILVVDDEPPLVSTIERTLHRRGFKVTSFSDPQAALRTFEEAPARFSAVITDQTMPHLGGIEMTSRLRALRSGVPVIVMTGNDAAEAARLFEGIPGILTLAKPVDVAALDAAVNAVLVSA